MPVTAVTNVTSPAATNPNNLDMGTTDAGTNATTLDRDAFLKLLVAQLKY
ncbi:MAG: hypothetical protein JWN99_3269, partial [Ilumatobacteraceae bacterium]|nr:hypothetical protein [Ilumatobacteraceae bacterium]